ncbi:site-specific recombinase XerC [uncultured Mediterranean phage uvMED]|nr:site-specific recombinase XerC [uncultured Mediterranean phage uvMED]
MKNIWDISAIKKPEYDEQSKRWLVYGVLPEKDDKGNYKRLRKRFVTKQEANLYRESQQDKWKVWSMKGTERRTRLTEEEELDAINALDLLKAKFPNDLKTITQGITFYCDQFNSKLEEEITIKEAVDRYLKSPKMIRNSDHHRNQSKYKLENFVDAFDDCMVADITDTQIEEYVYDENKDWEEKSRANQYAVLNTFFTFCKKKKLIADNPVFYVDKPSPENTEPVALSVSEVKMLMKVAEDVDAASMIPYFALAIFSAVRPSEILRLKWEKFVWDDEKPCFVIDGKGKRRRSVEMHPTCIAWIKPLAHSEGSVAPANAKKLFNLIRAIAGYRVSRSSIEISEAQDWEKKLKGCDSKDRPEWVRDVMRHTGITYYHKLINDKQYVASWAGNSPQVIDSNYRAVDGVTAGTCKKFWNILPSY